MVKLKEIAEELGVSVSMVSRVLTDKDRVDPEKRRLIKEALQRHNYVPNEMARGLRGFSSRSIGIIVPTLSSNYYTGIITAAQQVAMENGYTVITCCSNYSAERERDAVTLLKNKQIDRVMCASVMDDAEVYYLQKFEKGSVVLFDYDTAPDDSIGYIHFDAYNAAARLADYLCSLGHRRFLILNHCSVSMRKDGFLETLRRNMITLPQNCVIDELWLPELGYDACIELFREVKGERPTAVLATNDFLAYSAIRAARALGLRVPEDVSVACFDAFDVTGIITPEITCIMQSTEEIGTISANMLMNCECRHVILETDFNIGSSCQSPEM